MEYQTGYLSEACPAQENWWDIDLFRSFYRGSGNNPVQIHSPAEAINVSVDKKGNQSAIYLNRHWLHAGIRLSWYRGKLTDVEHQGLVEWDHWHTNFYVLTHQIHIDFISFFRLGPQTAYREYRVFENNIQIAQGGGFSGFLGGNFKMFRNWPLAVATKDFLIYIHTPLQPWYGRPVKGTISEKEVCSVWVSAGQDN